MLAAGSIEVLRLTSEEFIQAAALAVGSGSGRAAETYRQAYATGRFEPERTGVSGPTSEAYRGAFRLGSLRVLRVAEEETDAGVTAKAVLATTDGYEIECVRIPTHGGDDQALCVSSQVGCRMGCTFCETGRLGLIRQLTAAEIVAQVFTAVHELGWAPRNLVFMGMGEALDNVDNLMQALLVLTDRRGFHYSQERLTVCTSGHADGLQRLAALGWKRLNLSISLNAPDDVLRDRIMPVNRRTPLARLSEVLQAWPRRRNFVLGVNYCLLPGLNDGREQAQGIAAFCRPLGRTLVNLIPYNPGNEPLTRAPDEEEINRFVGWLRDDGVPVRRRVTKGRSIMAACGQLGNIDLRRQATARKSEQAPMPSGAGS